MSFADNSKTFLKQLSFEEVADDFWERVKRSTPETYLWEKGQPSPYTIELIYSACKKVDFQSVIFDIANTHFDLLRLKWPGKQVLLKFKFSAEEQYFTSGTLGYLASMNKLVVQLGNPFFISTKRSSCRFSPSKFDQIYITMGDRKFDCNDISSGGFSSLVKQVDVPSEFVKGAVFGATELVYNGKKFPVPRAVLVNLIDQQDDPALIKLAFKFEGLRPEEEDRIWVEVNRSVQKIADLS